MWFLHCQDITAALSQAYGAAMKYTIETIRGRWSLYVHGVLFSTGSIDLSMPWSPRVVRTTFAGKAEVEILAAHILGAGRRDGGHHRVELNLPGAGQLHELHERRDWALCQRMAGISDIAQLELLLGVDPDVVMSQQALALRQIGATWESTAMLLGVSLHRAKKLAQKAAAS
jgi:hypothetical protein